MSEMSNKAPKAGEKTYAHETGHLIGLADQYSDWTKDKTAEDDAMFKKPGRPEKKVAYFDGVTPSTDLMACHTCPNAKITQNEVKGIVDFVTKNKDKNGEVKINSKIIATKSGSEGGIGVTSLQENVNRSAAETYGYEVNKTTVKKK